MIIESVQINGFGCICREYEFSRGLNLIVAGNEAGKTTLADALISIIFGMKNGGKKGNGNSKLLRRYAPLNLDSFSASAVVRIEDGRRLNIWRDFALDKLRVLELSSGKDITLEYNSPPSGDCLGESLTGLSLAQYRKLAFLSQDELNKNWDFVEFVDALSALFSTDDSQGLSVEEAKAVLEESACSYEGISGKGKVKVETEIKRLENRLMQIDRETAEINKAYSEVEHRFEEAANKRLASEKIRNSLKKYDYLICLLHRDELLEKLHKKSESRQLISKIECEISELLPLKDLEFASIERMTTLLTRFSDKSERIADLQSVEQTSAEELEYLGKRVENLGSRANIKEGYIQKIELNIAVLESNLAREKSVRIDCRSAESLLVEAGVGSEEIRKYNSWKSRSREVEVEFVNNYQHIKEQIENKERGLEHEKEHNLSILREIISERMYRYKFARNNLILGCTFTALSVFSFVAMGFLLFMLIPAIACLGWAVFGAVKLAGVQRVGINEEAEAQEKIAALAEVLSGFAEKYTKMAEKLESFSEQVGVSSGELLNLLERIKKAKKEVEGWEQRVDRHKSIEGVIAESFDSLKEIFCEIGIAEEGTHLDLTRARVFLREVVDAVAVIEQHNNIRIKNAEICTQIEALQEEINEITVELAQHFAKAGVIIADNMYAAGMEEFKSKVALSQKLLQLQTVALPAAAAEAGDAEELSIIESEIETWGNRIAGMLEQDPWLATHNPKFSILEYGNEIKLLRIRLEDTEGELNEREKALAIEDGRRRERLPMLADERAEVFKALCKARSFAEAISQAVAVLDEISSELHARWSPLFSEEFNNYIERFSSKMEFSLSKDLKLCAILRETGMPIEGEGIAEYMSKGMRDQVYLSLRLLLSQKVSKDRALPVILDDPFINADERRFKEGMLQLLELSKDTQIFVFSCHEVRHDDLCFENEEFADALVKL